MNLQSALSSPSRDQAVGNWKSQGLGLHFLGTVPFDGSASFFGRLGLEQWQTQFNLNSNSGGSTQISTSHGSTSLAVGLGASYAVSPQLDATAEMIHYNRVGDPNSTGTTWLNTVNLGLRYHFH